MLENSKMAKPIILASASPRRADLLRQIGIEAEILPMDILELQEGKPAGVLVEKNALAKLQAAILLRPDRTIIAADTVVALNQQILGKPKSEAQAFSMLKFLSGKTHSVFTALAVVHENEMKTKVVETKVKFGVLAANEIWEYISTKESIDKAGAYGIQGKGALFVEEISGDYNNVVGLPLFALKALLPLANFIAWKE